MDMNEETIKLRTILMENRTYQLDSMSHFDIPLRIENVFTAQELKCGPDSENSFTFMDLSEDAVNNNTSEMAVTITRMTAKNEADIPTFEINDSDEDVIFVAEYNNKIPSNVTNEIPPLVSFPSRIVSRESDTSSSSICSDASPRVAQSSQPRRNPTRKARSIKYKKKCSEYITEEDLNILIASDEESNMIEMVDEIIPIVKETRPKKVVVPNWPAEGLHERPEYNEQTEEIEKFDYSIRQIQNSVKRAKAEKPKKLKVPKKKYVPKKYSYKKKKNNNLSRKKEVQMIPFKELSGLINETFTLLTETFMKNVVESTGLQKCTISGRNEDKENEFQRCSPKYEEILRNQSQLYCLGNGLVNSEEMYDKLKNALKHKNI